MTLERLAAWSAIATIPLMLAFGYVASRDAWGVASATERAHKPLFELGIGGGLPLDSLETTKVIIGARKVGEEKSVVIGELPFIVKNIGPVSLENLTITFRFPKFLHRDILENMAIEKSGSISATQLQHSFSENGELQYSSYLLPVLHPGETFAGDEPLYLHSTNLEVSAPVRTSDREIGTAALKIGYSIEFLVTIAAKDVLSRDYQFAYSTTKATSLDDLMRQAVEMRVASDLKTTRNSANFSQYLKAVTFGVPEKHLYLIFEELDEHRVEDGTLFSARREPSERLVSFQPVSWRLLF
jgi:hypothetical protein